MPTANPVNTHTVPPGYLEDSDGRLVRLDRVPPERVQADEVVRDLIGRVLIVQAYLADAKRAIRDDLAAHVALVAEKYGVRLDGRDGNVVLVSYDGRLKVERVTAERLIIGENILAAEQLIRAILDEIQDDVARAIVDRAFRRHRRTGQLSAARLVDLSAVELDDPRWQTAVTAIRDALRTAGSVTYYRCYRRDRADQPWQYLSMDFSQIALPDPPAGTAAPGGDA